ncbi:MAG: HlyD family secretion protein [Burkholderiales bacterium]
MTLFRKEVQQAQAAQWMGTVRLNRPISFSVVTAATVVLAVLFASFSVWGEVNRKARLSGILVPTQGSLNITAPQAGVVAERRVQEGDVVEAGEVLLVINAERQSLIGAGGSSQSVGDTSALVAQQIESRRQALVAERNFRELQTRQREQVLNDRLRTLDAQLRASEDELLGQRHRVRLAEKTVERILALAKEGFVSEAQAQAKQEELIDARNREQSLQRAGLGVQQERQALVGERQALVVQLQTDLSQLDRSLASTTQEATENSARKTAVVTAPLRLPTSAAGAGNQVSSSNTPRYRVTGLNLQVGQFVQAGQNLATLVPENAPGDSAAATPALEAQLFAPSRTAGFVATGQPVYLRYAAYPYQKFGLYKGRITAISATPFAASELPPNLAPQIMAQAGSQEALYRINVQLEQQAVFAYGQNHPLKAGLTLDADVLQDRRRIWEWVLEPVLAARAQLQVLGAQDKTVPAPRSSTLQS